MHDCNQIEKNLNEFLKKNKKYLMQIGTIIKDKIELDSSLISNVNNINDFKNWILKEIDYDKEYDLFTGEIYYDGREFIVITMRQKLTRVMNRFDFTSYFGYKSPDYRKVLKGIY